ncbi:uncharacterized protein J3R85_016109 [Psidium guajava]|nr:uncharacterized protein J3R85_016109 [Psidium guajava]
MLELHNRWNSDNKKPLGQDLNLYDKWKPPKNPALKLNINELICTTNVNGAVAGVLRDYKGILLDGFAEKIQAWLPLEAEAKALLIGLKFLEKKKEMCGSVILDSDCCTLTKAVNSHGDCCWEVEKLINEAHIHLAQMLAVSVEQCDRRTN